MDLPIVYGNSAPAKGQDWYYREFVFQETLHYLCLQGEP